MLKSGRSNIIHIIVNEFDSPFYSKLVESLVTETTARGLTPFVEQTRYSPDAAKHALANNPFSGQLFDGAVRSDDCEQAVGGHEQTSGEPAHVRVVGRDGRGRRLGHLDQLAVELIKQGPAGDGERGRADEHDGDGHARAGQQRESPLQ